MHPVPLAALRDNYIWVIQDDRKLTVIDPGEANPVLNYCQEHDTTVSFILITHHHHDHTGGIQILKKHFPHVQVIGPADLRMYTPDIPIHKDTKMVQTTHPKRTWHILHTPGHTMDHICYHCDEHFFCGDTLFSAGCGRAFEGQPSDLYDAFTQISKLPNNTVLYPAHEYTYQNCLFALRVDPNNPHLQQATQEAREKTAQKQPTLPTTLAREKNINPFLRTHTTCIQNNLKQITDSSLTNPLEVFATLRKIKDNY